MLVLGISETICHIFSVKKKKKNPNAIFSNLAFAMKHNAKEIKECTFMFKVKFTFIAFEDTISFLRDDEPRRFERIIRSNWTF